MAYSSPYNTVSYRRANYRLYGDKNEWISIGSVRFHQWDGT